MKRVSPVVIAFVAIACASQVVVHHRQGRGWAFAVGYPVGALVLFALVVFLVDRFAGEAPASEVRRRPVLELALACAAVAVHIAWLLPQAPSAAFAHNPVSSGLARVAGLVLPAKPWWAHPLFFGVAIPCALLAPVRPTADAFGLRGFRWQVLFGVAAIYTPLLFLSGASLTIAGAGAYLLGAALPEELLYRAVLQDRLQQRFDRDLALVIAALVFGFMHLPINAKQYGWATAIPFCIGQNAFGGAITGVIWSRTRSLPLVVLQHALAGIAMGAS